MALADTARLLASLELDSSKFVAGTRSAGAGLQNLETRGQRVGRSMGKVGHAISTALGIGLERVVEGGIGLLSSAIRDGVAGAEELEKVNIATATVISSTGRAAGLTADDISNLANKYEDLNATIDNKVIQSGENVLLTFTNISKKAFEPAAEAALNLNQAMGGGEGGLQGTIVQLGKALNDPVKGLTALSRVGVSFSTQQQKQIKDLVAHNKLYEAQKVILDELSKEFGGQFTRAGQSAEAQAAALADSFDDLKIAFATGLLPGLKIIRTELTRTFRDPATIAAVTNLGKQIGGLFTPGNIQAGISLVKGAFKFIGDLPWGAIKSSFQIAGEAGKTLFNLFNSAPDWLKTAVLTGWGLNKLTGGLAGDLFSSLAGGLIKGVLGMNAGVVNINAGTVVGGGGPSGAVGAAESGLSGVQKMFLVGEAIGLTLLVNQIRQGISDGNTQRAQQIHQSLDKNITGKSDAELTTALGAVQKGINDLQANPLNVLVQGDALNHLKQMEAELKGEQARRNAPAGQTGKGSIGSLLAKGVLNALPVLKLPGLEGKLDKNIDKLASLEKQLSKAKDSGDERRIHALRERIDVVTGRVDQAKQGITSATVATRDAAARAGNQAAAAGSTVAGAINVQTAALVAAIFAARPVIQSTNITQSTTVNNRYGASGGSSNTPRAHDGTGNNAGP